MLTRLPDLHLVQNTVLGGTDTEHGQTYFLYERHILDDITTWVPTRDPAQWKTDPRNLGDNEYIVTVFPPAFSVGTPSEVKDEICDAICRHLEEFRSKTEES